VVEFEFQLPRSERSCSVRVGAGLLDALVGYLGRVSGRARLVLISDANVAALHTESLRSRVLDRGIAAELIVFPAGEANKVRKTKSILEDRLLDLGIGRDCLIVAVGGGVTGDLAGFVAATWHRGTPLVQVPTTLLAMVDAAVGGKTAVNLRAGKNLVGAFHQPLSVWADVDFLATQAEEDYRDGFAEAVKMAAVADADLFSRLERNVAALASRSGPELIDVIGRSMRLKAGVVMRDEYDAAQRAVLNFGHTVAHALESASGYSLSHGRAVAVGVCVEARLATKATGFPAADRQRLETLLAGLGLPTRVPAGVSLEAVVEATGTDKKARGGEVRYALPAGIGRMPASGDPCVTLGAPLLLEALRDAVREG